MIASRFLPAAALVLLAACGDKSTPQEGGLQGEVLDGTISDAMVPLDKVRSRAPLAMPEGETGAEGSAPARRDGGAADALDAEQPTPGAAEAPATADEGQAG